MPKASRLALAVVSAILAAPAALFFFAAIGRTLQPTAHEPSRTLDTLVTWFLGTGGLSLLVLLLVLPFVAVLMAIMLLLREWATDPTLRSDLAAVRRALRPIVRRPALLLAVLVVLFGSVYFSALVIHGLVG